MFRVMKLKSGEYCIETDLPVFQVSGGDGAVSSFIEPISLDELDELVTVANQELVAVAIERLMQP